MEAGDWREAPKAPSRRTKAPVKDLGKTYVIFDKLRRDGRDSVWAYVARNLSRPLAFSAARFLRCVRRRFICVQAASSVSCRRSLRFNKGNSRSSKPGLSHRPVLPGMKLGRWTSS
jgi:hypothetical protein